jgi:hypothetical protein
MKKVSFFPLLLVVGSGSGIKDGRIRDTKKWSDPDPGPGINIPDPQHWRFFNYFRKAFKVFFIALYLVTTVTFLYPCAFLFPLILVNITINTLIANAYPTVLNLIFIPLYLDIIYRYLYTVYPLSTFFLGC